MCGHCSLHKLKPLANCQWPFLAQPNTQTNDNVMCCHMLCPQSLSSQFLPLQIKCEGTEAEANIDLHMPVLTRKI